MVISLMFTLHIGLQNRKGGIIMLKKKDNNKKETNKLEKIIHKITSFTSFKLITLLANCFISSLR